MSFGHGRELEQNPNPGAGNESIARNRKRKRKTLCDESFSPFFFFTVSWILFLTFVFVVFRGTFDAFCEEGHVSRKRWL